MFNYFTTTRDFYYQYNGTSTTFLLHFPIQDAIPPGGTPANPLGITVNVYYAGEFFGNVAPSLSGSNWQVVVTGLPAVAPAGSTIQLVRVTPSVLVSGYESLQLLNLIQETMDQVSIGDGARFPLAPKDPLDPSKGTAYQILPDNEFPADPLSANPGGWDDASFRFQAGHYSDDDSLSIGWYSTYLKQPDTPPTITGPNTIYGLSVNMATNVPAGPGDAMQSASCLHAVSAIDGTTSGKAEALVVEAFGKDDDGSCNGKLVGCQSLVGNNGVDTGRGATATDVPDGSYQNYAYAANANGIRPGFCAYVAKTQSDESETGGAGWYNGFVVDYDTMADDSETENAGPGRAFWYVQRFVVTHVDVGDVRTSMLGVGHDEPLAPLHLKYPDIAEARIENSATLSDNDTAGMVSFYGTGASGTPTRLARVQVGMSNAGSGVEAGTMSFWAANAGTLSRVWNMSQGLWAQSATGQDKGLQTINIGSGSTGGYYFAGSQVVKSRKTGWGAPGATNLSRASYSSYAGQTISSPPTQAQVQSLDNAVKLLSQTVTALLNDLHASTSGHGLIGA